MMLFDPAIDMQPLTDVVQQARGELRVQAEVLPPSLRPALESAQQRGVLVRYLIGPKASYTLDAKGRPLVPRRAFENGPNAEDLAFANATGDVMINPRFSELGLRDTFQPGVRSHAFYLVADRAVLCTSVPQPPAQSICIATGEPVAAALAALHKSEFNDRRAEKESRSDAAARSLVVGPDDNKPLLALLATPGALVLTSELDQGRAFSALVAGGNKTLYVHPDLMRLPAIAAARRAGVKVSARSLRFDGTIVWTPGRAFMGSQRLTDAALARDRDVGLLLQHEGADALRKVLERAR